MPPTNSLVGVEWLNENSLRNFPLVDGASSKDVTGSFTLPQDVIVDLIVPVSYSAGLNPGKFHLYEVGVLGDGLTIKIGYGGVHDGNVWTTAPEVVCKASISAVTHTPNTSYLLFGEGDFADSVGKITIGELEAVQRFAGLFQFDLTGGRIVPTLIKPDIRGITSIKVRNGSDLSDPVYGDVELVAGTNMQIVVDGQQITFNAIDGLNLNEDCGCVEGADRELPDPIRTINGVTPNSVGNINLNGLRCIQITSGTNQLNMADICSDPCCTSEELQRILDDKSVLTKDIRLNLLTVQQLETRLIQMESLVSAIEATGFIIT